MAIDRSSRTALLTASYRARFTAATPPLCDDPWAAAIAGDEGAKLAASLDEAAARAGGGASHVGLWVAVRTAFLDAEVKRLATPQVVILGAGFDTRAARLARSGVRFFEVDQPHTQAEKRARLNGLDRYPRDAANYVTCDFEREDFVDRLRANGFALDEPATFVWEGVSMYLTEPAVRATLRRIADGCDPRSTLLFDYVGKKLATGEGVDAIGEGTRANVEALGEPFRFGVNDALPLLYQEGYRHVEITSFDEACLNLTGTYVRERMFRFQFLALARVAR